MQISAYQQTDHYCNVNNWSGGTVWLSCYDETGTLANTKFRVEINTAYRTRHGELLAAYIHDHGRLPVANTDVDPKRLGRISPG